MEIQIGNRLANVTLVSKEGNRVVVDIDGTLHEVDLVMAENGNCSIISKGNSFNAELIRSEKGNSYDVTMYQRAFHIDILDTQARYLRMRQQDDDQELDSRLIAPMAGKVVSIPVSVGDELQAGDTAIVLEAMKMQNNYKVAAPCRVHRIAVSVGEAVLENQLLIELEEISKEA